MFLGWQLLPGDPASTGFHIYRNTRRDTSGERITTAPVSGATDFIDRAAPGKGRAYYRVRTVGAGLSDALRRRVLREAPLAFLAP